MDTIFALSSGQPPAAIAIIRISGRHALAIANELTGKPLEPRVATLVRLRHGGDLLDRALALRFDGPHSATGEDLIEFHLHGGRAVVAAVLAALDQFDGTRAAEPGEFTRRAFLNSRIDLAEAEGLADLLTAETESQRRAALRLAGGALGRLTLEWATRVLVLAGEVEAQLDFSDEDDVGAGLSDRWRQHLATLQAEIAAALLRPPAERLRDGVRVVIAGPPNSGKSSLLNALVGREAAITSEIAGTTRDLIEIPVAIAGIPFVLIDSAGLRTGTNPIESIGISRAEAAVAAADIVIWLGPSDECPDKAGVILVQSKSDLGLSTAGTCLRVSSVTGDGLDGLLALLGQSAARLLPGEGEVAFNLRQRAAVQACAEHLSEAVEQEDLLIAAEALRLARMALDRVTGRSGVADLLDTIFSRFCIGK